MIPFHDGAIFDNGAVRKESAEGWLSHRCQWCEEWATLIDVFVVTMICDGVRKPFHRECFIRQTCGSLGHVRKVCPCYGGNEEDPPGMTRREAAKAVAEFIDRDLRQRA